MGLVGTPHPTLVPLPAEDVSSEYLHGVWLGKINTRMDLCYHDNKEFFFFLRCEVMQIHIITSVLQRQAATCMVYLPF